MIEAEGLTKRYGSVTAIEDLNFRVDRGEIVGFLGPNGAGKTTAMRVLTGYLPPTEGTARIAGYDIFSESLEARRRVGYMPETVPLYSEMTVSGYLHFMAEIRGVQDRRSAVGEAMSQCHIERRARQVIGTLSKGYRQRVGLAQALLHRPEVLILDEPMIGLDPRQIIDVRGLIRELGEDRAILLSSHVLPEISQVCTRVLIIHQGRIVAEGSPEGLTVRLQGETRMSVRLARPSADARQALAAIAGMQSVEVCEDDRYEIVAAPQADVRDAVSRAVVEGGWGLLELRPVGMSLEEIFLQLTEENAAAVVGGSTEREEEPDA